MGGGGGLSATSSNQLRRHCSRSNVDFTLLAYEDALIVDITPDVCSRHSDLNFKCRNIQIGLRLARSIDLAVFKCIFNDTVKFQDYTASVVKEWMSTGKWRHDTGSGKPLLRENLSKCHFVHRKSQRD
jgi:hypothetical protein